MLVVSFTVFFDRNTKRKISQFKTTDWRIKMSKMHSVSNLDIDFGKK